MVILNHQDMSRFLMAAEGQFGDPAEAVFLLGVEYSEVAERDHATAQYSALMSSVLIDLGGKEPVVLEVNTEAPRAVDGELEAFHVVKMSAGTWALNPSLNIPGALHAYVVLHSVPDPAPWEKRLVTL